MKKDTSEMGNITKMAVACARFSSKPVFCNNGTAIIPPPPPNKLFAAPTATPQLTAVTFPFFASSTFFFLLFTIL